METNNTKLFTVKWQDIGQGAVNAIIAAVVIGFSGIVTQPGFDLFTLNWGTLLHSMINWAFAAFIGSVGKDFLTTKNGNLAGVIRVKEPNQ